MSFAQYLKTGGARDTKFGTNVSNKMLLNDLKETPMQVFSCKIDKVCKNTFISRTPPVAASVVFSANQRNIQ